MLLPRDRLQIVSSIKKNEIKKNIFFYVLQKYQQKLNIK